MTTEPTPSLASAALAFKRCAFRNGWTTFNVRDADADEAERRLLASSASAPESVEMSPEFTDTARAALLWVLWHHQGGSSNVGQPIRFALGMGQHEHLSDHQISEAKRWAALAQPTAAQQAAAPRAEWKFNALYADTEVRAVADNKLLAVIHAGSEQRRIVAALKGEQPFQKRVQPWLLACFGEMIAGDREERNHRFIEEALELVQACGCTASEAHQLVDYVFARPVGEKAQEVGGVMVTLAALCLAQGLDMAAAGETELARIWTKVEQIRAKQAAKPKHSPLPVAPARCGYCDDTGDVHGLDGEWRGVCNCAAGDRVRAAVASPDDTPLETGEGDSR